MSCLKKGEFDGTHVITPTTGTDEFGYPVKFDSAAAMNSASEGGDA